MRVDDRGRWLLAAVLASTPAIAEELTLPPVGFLEYLGAMVEHDGQLMDPLALVDDLEDDVTAASSDQPRPGKPVLADNAEEAQ